ncbi:hypothetical protein [Natrarchaeobius oligotrophus]|uniref:Uncharacterized protein n=1 Tax=Natrarchaeobius chitinivorans TaxID=1679083 RepID=A0A3N6MIQ3_NATCH|nr:hypothetical protein [Natrarchaeobius chitinivorans]RQG96850.1 hypothetical protein EA472_20000 [Natrarchaeobius chitinivorans]
MPRRRDSGPHRWRSGSDGTGDDSSGTDDDVEATPLLIETLLRDDRLRDADRVRLEEYDGTHPISAVGPTATTSSTGRRTRCRRGTREVSRPGR